VLLTKVNKLYYTKQHSLQINLTQSPLSMELAMQKSHITLPDENSSITRKSMVVFLVMLLSSCQPTLVNDATNLKATEGYSAEQTNKLFVVDCLLPSQVRKLGSLLTYLSARRPIKTTAADCEIRGGEYVAYDRSNYASALKVWLPQAKKGDAEAQVVLGEIYEKGLGGLTDPALAAQWYRKAAAQGSSRAQINLGHLYEKGLGVEQSLATALNWYRKASGLDDTDLEFASVTEANVSAGYEKQLQGLKATSKGYQQQASELRKQLKRSQQSLSAQQKKLNDQKSQLEKSRQLFNQEKNKKEANRQLLIKLEQTLHENQASYDSQKSQLTKLQIEEKDVSQASVSSYQLQLENQQQQLQLKESQYHDAFVDIKRKLKQIEAKSIAAQTTQDELLIEQLRGKLNADKANLLVMGKRVKQLKITMAENKKIVNSLEIQGGNNILLAQAKIEIIEPSMVLTRGVPSYQLRSISRNKKIIGKVSQLRNLESLTVNGQSTEMDKEGVFQATIEIKDDLNPVKIIANYKKGAPSLLSFNLLAKAAVFERNNIKQPVKAVAKSYPSINFGRFYALVIGNQKYDQLPTLKTSVNDAKAVDEVLRRHYGYKTTLLINANRHQIMTAFNDLRAVLTKKDNLLIYYAGHGEIDKSDQSAYWLPTDAEMNNSANWLSSHSITQFLNIIEARHILVVADSCYSGAMTRTSIARLPTQMAEDKRKKWLNFMVKRKARTVMTSGGVKPVLDSGGGQHSVFAKAFLNVLENNAGLIEDYELFRSISGNVKRSASLVGFQQEPQYSSMLHAGHEGSPFFFVSNSH